MKNGNVWVSVSHEAGGTSEREIPYSSVFPGAAFTPRQGEMVEIYEVDGQNFARAAHAPRNYPMPDLSEGEFVFRFDENTEIRVTKNGGVFDLNLSASGTVTVGDSAKATAAVTDIDVTKDSNGKVTSVTPVLSTETYIE